MSKSEALREAVEAQREFEAVSDGRRAAFRRARVAGVSLRELSSATGLTVSKVRTITQAQS
jgi:DNA-directed RNA polymerase specialized sigma24 family protein